MSQLTTDHWPLATALDWEPHRRRLREFDPVEVGGRVTQIVGQVVEAQGPAAHLGDLCLIHGSPETARRGSRVLAAEPTAAGAGPRGGGEGARRRNGETEIGVPVSPSPCSPTVPAEVVGFRRDSLLLMPLGRLQAIGPHSRVTLCRRALEVPVGEELLGRVLDPLGRPLDEGGELLTRRRYPLQREPPPAMQRPRIDRPLALGVRAIDGLLSLGCGQRVGIFAGSGVGKSTLLGAIARNTAADVNVVALIGERGREVREFIERDLGAAGLARSVVIVATSDQPAVLRIKGALAATAVAEYFRDEGARVMLMMDSLTRFAWAQREIGLAIGEPPTTRGYTPSVFALLPQLLERTGTSARGSITGLYTVLVEGDDMNEPIADAARSILDGHVVLRRELAAQGHYPAIDVLESVSRLMGEIVDDEHRRAAQSVRELMATYARAVDLIQIGAYVAGSDLGIDRAIRHRDAIRDFLRQSPEERETWEETRAALLALDQD